MRVIKYVLVVFVLASACDYNRTFERYTDFERHQWLVGEKPEFQFDITDTVQRYNLYCNLRNEESYPFSDFRFTYYLQDSLGNLLDKRLVTEYLFDKKTGKPFGSSGLGDIYDHQFLLLENYAFQKSGKYRMRFEQFMRADTLAGIRAVGLRVQKIEESK